jgi:hypothetical protein
MIYDRRTRAGMVVSSIRRNAPLDEVQFRKRAYDEAYVDWNKNVLLNLFVIREVGGELKFAALEQMFEDDLVGAMADVDRCLTKAYDRKLAGRIDLHRRALQADAVLVPALQERMGGAQEGRRDQHQEGLHAARARGAGACATDHGARDRRDGARAARTCKVRGRAPTPTACARPREQIIRDRHGHS